MLRLPYAEAVDIEGAAVGASLRVSPAGALVVSAEVAFARDDFARVVVLFAVVLFARVVFAAVFALVCEA